MEIANILNVIEKLNDAFIALTNGQTEGTHLELVTDGGAVAIQIHGVILYDNDVNDDIDTEEVLETWLKDEILSLSTKLELYATGKLN